MILWINNEHFIGCCLVLYLLPPARFWKRREVLFWVPSPSPPSPRMFCLISRLLLKLAFWNLACAIYAKTILLKCFLDFLKILNCSFDRHFKNFWQKIVCARNLKNRWVDFHEICTAGTSKLVDVQCKFMFKSDNKILSYGRFKIVVQACPGWGDGNDPDYFVLSLYISVAIKVRFLKFNMFNRYKNNISKLVLNFF